MTYENYEPSYKGHPINKIITWLVDDFCEAHGFRKASSINKGMCDYFADDLLGELGGETADTYIIEMDSLWYQNENGKFEYEKYGKLPEGLDINQVHIGDHVWVYHKGKHYDAETPNGVDNFFDLPHCQRYLKKLG